MALASMFAACTNDDFLENGAPQASVEGQERPTISGVALSVEGADTRAIYSGGQYKFEKGDVISALLMDENNTGIRYGVTTNTDEWNKLTWLEKYHLVDYVHTNFPFTYDGSKFSSDCNMLEGNYFLTYPYVCLDGNRQGRIDIAQQVQFGDDKEARREAMVKNQRFVGYAKLDAGEGVSDFQARLVPLLAPVRIAIKSDMNMDSELIVTKIVLSHPKLTGTLMVDPTRAEYSDPMINEQGGWNLWQDYVQNHTDAMATESGNDIWHFNYANYLAHQPGTTSEEWKGELYYNGRYGSLNDYDYVYNVKGEAGQADEVRLKRKPNTYYWDDAIRAAVQPMREFNNPEYATQYVELKLGKGSYENGKPVFTEEGLKLLPSASGLEYEDGKNEDQFIEALVMLPAFQGDETPLYLTIYTNQGIIKDINLSKQAQGEGNDVKTSGVLDRFDPTDKHIQRIVVTLDNPSILKQPTDVVINNEDDLKQWVGWLNDSKPHTGNKNPIATFTNDITIDDELAAAIRQLDESYILTIKSDAAKGNNLRIAVKDLAEENGKSNADILEYLDVDNGVKVEVMSGATLNMTDKSYNIKHEISAIPGYPDHPQGMLNIEVAEGGTLNITSNDKTSIMGGYDAAGKPVANRTEVNIENAGTIKVGGTQAVNLLGFHIINEGTMEVAQGSSLYFAPNSVNTIRGTINVEGVISGTTLNNFVNKGEINIGKENEKYTKAPEVRNILNEGNDLNKEPGKIIFQNEAAKADLSSNTGIVDYQKYLNGVTFNNASTSKGWSVEGVFKYTGAGKNVSDLDEAYVTDADITEGKLVTNVDGESYLKNLIVRNGATVERFPNGNKTLTLNNFNGGLETSILLEGGATVNDVFFYQVNVLNALVDGTNGVQTLFKGEVALCSHEKGAAPADRVYAGLYLKKADVRNEGKLQVGALESYDGSNSDFENAGELHLPVGIKVGNNITMHLNEAISDLQGDSTKPEWGEAEATIADGQTLADVFAGYQPGYANLNTITIKGQLDMSLPENAAYAEVFEGNDIVLGAGAGLLNAEGLTANSLVMGGAAATISGTGKGNTIITVNTLDFAMCTLTASKGNIMIPIEAIEGTPCPNITFSYGGGIKSDGTASVVSENGLWFQFSSKTWKK